MKNYLFAIALICFGSSAARAESFFQHADLTPSSIQGQFFTGASRTNKGWGQLTMMPLFFRNAAASDPWYKPSFSPLAIGGTFGHGDASLAAGAVVDVGPQIIMGMESVVGLFSDAGKTSVSSFFNCSAAATACAALSAGALANLTVEENGTFSRTLKEWGRHPVAYFIGPSLLFGNRPLAARRR